MGTPCGSMGTLGIVGGGQLARMTALAAHGLGFRVHAFAEERRCPVAGVVDRLHVAALNDLGAAQRFVARCDAVTIDIEHTPLPFLELAASRARAVPQPAALYIAQDRGRQKTWLESHGFAVGPFRVCEHPDALRAALRELGPAAYVKAATAAFDGRGQCRASPDLEPAAVLARVGSQRVTVERALPLRAELSVLVARRAGGELKVYPPALNYHEHGVLSWSLLPGPLPDQVTSEAQAIATRIAQELDVHGLCVVELFLGTEGQLLVNEFSLRPHNSYHGSERACETSQFAQLVRAAFDLPLGSTSIVRPTAMANLLGDLWTEGEPDFRQALAVPSVSVHLYGKLSARKRRKLGHLSAVGADVLEAKERVLSAHSALHVPALRQ